jgi:hypothetical protein
MAVVLNTGEVMFCKEVDVFDTCVLADMVFVPITEVYEIMETEGSA